MKFTAHASSSAGNLYSLTEDGLTLAIECGLRFPALRAALDFNVAALDGLLLSHHHGDHSRSCRDVMRAGVDIWASGQTWDALKLDGPHQKFLVPKVRVMVGPWAVVPFDLRHDAPGTLGFVVVAPSSETLVFVCDTAYSPYTFPAAEIIAVEVNHSEEILRASELHPAQKRRSRENHMSLERAIRLLQANDLSKTREIHLLHLSDGHGDAEGFRKAVAAATGKPVYVAPK